MSKQSRKSGIYCIENLINRKKYIGSSVDINARWRLHIHHLNQNKHHNKHFQNAVLKYGIDNFNFQIIEVVADPCILIEREQYYIDYFQSANILSGYNICKKAGSSLGVKRSDEFKKKCSESKMGTKNVRFGIKLTEETLKKCSESKIGLKNPMYGQKVKEESKRKREETLIKKYGSKSPNKGNIGSKNSASKAICQIKEGKIIRTWDCISDIQRELGFNITHIISVAKGRRKSASGYQWEYENVHSISS